MLSPARGLIFCRPKESYTFERLELEITSFLSSFYSLMDWFLKGLQEKSTMGPRLDLPLVPIKKDHIGSVNGNGKGVDPVSGEVVRQASWSMQNQDSFVEFENCLESFPIRREGPKYDMLFFDVQYLTGERLS